MEGGAENRRAMLILCIACVLDICRAFMTIPWTDDARRGQHFLSWSGKQWNTPRVSQGLLPKRNPRCKGGFLLARSMAEGPSESLKRGEWFKLICGASNQDMPQIRNLALAYTRKLSSSIFSIPHPLPRTLPFSFSHRLLPPTNTRHGTQKRTLFSWLHLAYILKPVAPPRPRLRPPSFLSVLLISQLCPLF
jgi:hypothetical protein